MRREDEYRQLADSVRRRGGEGKKRATEGAMGNLGGHLRATCRSIEEDR
jgi:hypothetical protein